MVQISIPPAPRAGAASPRKITTPSAASRRALSAPAKGGLFDDGDRGNVMDENGRFYWGEAIGSVISGQQSLRKP
ncbi:MAG: hypothetical protein J6S75_14025, partial [Thermoguttaceae bacterium]|nr:hypothetical protein [Thermoguttaceae bacterium]